MRSVNALENYRILTVQKLLETTDYYISRMRNVGERTNSEILEVKKAILTGTRFELQEGSKLEKEAEEYKDKKIRFPKASCTIFGSGHKAEVLANAFRDGFLSDYLLALISSSNHDEAWKIHDAAGKAAKHSPVTDRTFFFTELQISDYFLSVGSDSSDIEAVTDALKAGSNVVTISNSILKSEPVRKKLESIVKDLRKQYGLHAPQLYIMSDKKYVRLDDQKLLKEAEEKHIEISRKDMDVWRMVSFLRKLKAPIYTF